MRDRRRLDPGHLLRPGGPWTAGDPAIFPDMPGLAADMKKTWCAPWHLDASDRSLMTVDDPKRLRAGPCTAQEKPLDLSRCQKTCS